MIKKKIPTPESIFKLLLSAFLLLNIACKKEHSEIQDMPYIQPKVSDIDGNIYRIVQIGTQIWMKENLRVTKLNDGTAIPFIANETEWSQTDEPAYTWFNNEERKYGSRYGCLYNWHTVSSEKLCPTGWHVPTNDDWLTLTNYLGGDSIAGGKMKVAGTLYWEAPNEGATNESGFSALPGGHRNHKGEFICCTHGGLFWSSNEYTNPNSAYHLSIWYVYTSALLRFNDKKVGFSVRCLKD